MQTPLRGFLLQTPLRSFLRPYGYGSNPHRRERRFPPHPPRHRNRRIPPNLVGEGCRRFAFCSSRQAICAEVTVYIYLVGGDVLGAPASDLPPSSVCLYQKNGYCDAVVRNSRFHFANAVTEWRRN